MPHRTGLNRFRSKLRVTLMLVIATTTGIALYVVQQRTTADAELTLQREFRQAVAGLHRVEEVRLNPLIERCKALSESVRVRSALEEDAVEELYENARLELRDLIDGATPASRALPFVFLDAQGKLIKPPRPEAWNKQCESPGPPSEQGIRYLRYTESGGSEGVMEVISTPIVREDTQELLGAMVLKFTPAALQPQQRNIPLYSGIWLEDHLFLPALHGQQATDLADQISRKLAASRKIESNFRVQISDAPYLLFYKLLNPNSRFPPAYEVCVYPFKESMAHLQELRWQILAAGAALLAAGLIASHFISSQLSEPVAKLEVDSEENRAHRERAEAALELTNEELRQRNLDLQKALTELKAAQQQIIQQERLRALGEMASGIAHDFNNALVPILGFCELLQLNPAILADRKKSAQYLETIQTAATDAAKVVSRLREFYRNHDENEVYAPVDLRKLAEQAIKLTQPKWKGQAQASGATVKVSLEGESVPLIAGSESCLRELLTNLIFNAVDAMPRGGRIVIRTRQDAEHSIMEIADTGTGMTEEVRRRCLEPFFSTKGERGTGLGLSMVFGIVQRHGGTIDLQSEIGQGTTFIIKFPILRDGACGSEAGVQKTPQVPLRVLVVDDEAQVRHLLTEVLKSDGHSVEIAEEASDGLRRFSAGDFDLVITDKAMPGMSGDQLAAAIKEIDPKAPVILLTGFGQFLEQGSIPNVDFIASKPIGVAALRNAISTAFKVA